MIASLQIAPDRAPRPGVRLPTAPCAAASTTGHTPTVATRTFNDELLATLPRLYAAARRIGLDHGEAEDLVQATCLRALERRAQFMAGTNISGWLMAILRNLQVDEFRRRKKLSIVAVESIERYDAPAEDEAPPWMALGTEDVANASRTLPAAQERVLRLFYLERRSYTEIAVALGIPLATVATRLFRARCRVRQQLSARWDEPTGNISAPQRTNRARIPLAEVPPGGRTRPAAGVWD